MSFSWILVPFLMSEHHPPYLCTSQYLKEAKRRSVAHNISDAMYLFYDSFILQKKKNNLHWNLIGTCLIFSPHLVCCLFWSNWTVRLDKLDFFSFDLSKKQFAPIKTRRQTVKTQIFTFLCRDLSHWKTFSLVCDRHTPAIAKTH